MSLGDFTPSKVIYFTFTTRAFSTGIPTQLAGTPSLEVYKDGSDTPSTAGITLTVDFSSVTGLNHVAIDTAADGTFYSAGSSFNVVIAAGTVGGVSVVGESLASFTLSKISSLRPTTADRTLDVTATGEAGIDWANIGSPTQTVNLSGTTVKTATDVEADTADIQTRLPAALVSGRMDSDAVAISGSTSAADAVENNIANLDAAISTRATAAAVAALNNLSSAQVETIVNAYWNTNVLADSVAALGDRPTPAQALIMITRFLFEKSTSGVTLTVTKEDGSTESMTFELDDADNPTSIHRAS